jgi:site-specific recombinase XerD
MTIADDCNLPMPAGSGRVSAVAQLATIPEEEIWLHKQKSARTRRAYRLDVQHFMATLHISSVDELRQVDHKAVIAWERFMREVEGAASSTIRRRLAALSSLFRHLIDYGAAGNAGDSDGPMFRPLKHNGKRQEERRRMDPDPIDRVTRKYAAALGLERGYSAHSMRATFITTALENGAQLEDVQKAAGHRDPSTTKLYDRRGYNPEKAASFLATY